VRRRAPLSPACEKAQTHDDDDEQVVRAADHDNQINTVNKKSKRQLIRAE
jgi:hypothetical protein